VLNNEVVLLSNKLKFYVPLNIKTAHLETFCQPISCEKLKLTKANTQQYMTAYTALADRHVVKMND